MAKNLNAVEHALEFFKLLCVGVWLWFNPKISWVKFQLTQIEQSRFLDLPYGNQHGSWNPSFLDDFPISMPSYVWLPEGKSFMASPGRTQNSADNDHLPKWSEESDETPITDKHNDKLH